MSERESWPKPLRCPVCGREGVAWLSHLETSPDDYEQKTVVETCPEGFESRPDEDEPSIVRFFCAKDDVSADQ